MTEPEHPRAPAQELPLAFHGTAAEYFRIWIVNFCLTLLTLGLFSGWAKVRRKRYLYANTTLDGTPFQYLGRPLPILLGRLLAALMLTLTYIGWQISLRLLFGVLLLAASILPWAIVRSAAFAARYSAFRGIRFTFDGTRKELFRAMNATGLVPALLIGSALNREPEGALAALILLVAACTVPFAYAALRRFLVTHTRFGGCRGEMRGLGRAAFGIVAVAVLALLALMVGIDVGWRVLLNVFHVDRALLPAYAVVFTNLAYVAVYAHVQARLANLMWNNTRVGPMVLSATLDPLAMRRLYLTNAVAVVASLGLLTPWAVIRTLRYRIANLHVRLESDLGELRGEPATAAPVGGARGLLDIEFSL